MKLTWHGHACFTLETDFGTVVFDPYEPGYVPGVELPELTADIVVCSHEHGDHCYPQGVKLSGKEHSLKFLYIDTFHDEAQGRKRGKNIVTLVEAGDLRVVHMGDIGHLLSGEQLEALGKVDVLIIPTGGFYTIDAQQAWQHVKAIRPKVTVPMHYRGEGFGFDVIASVEEFTKLADNVRFYDTNVLDLRDTEGEFVAVLKCPAK